MVNYMSGRERGDALFDAFYNKDCVLDMPSTAPTEDSNFSCEVSRIKDMQRFTKNQRQTLKFEKSEVVLKCWKLKAQWDFP